MKLNKSLNAKLCDLQGLVIKKDATNPFFKNKYASLEQIITTLTPQLKEKKLLITHALISNTVNTVVTDVESGEYIMSGFTVNTDLKPQEIGSAITYGRRYNIVQLFNLVTDEDDDGQLASTSTALNKAIAEVATIQNLEDLKFYYEKNKHLGAKFANAVVEKKKVLNATK